MTDFVAEMSRAYHDQRFSDDSLVLIQRELAALLDARLMNEAVPEVFVEALRKLHVPKARQVPLNKSLKALPHFTTILKSCESIDAADKYQTGCKSLASLGTVIRRIEVVGDDPMLELFGQVRTTEVNLRELYVRREIDEITDPHNIIPPN
ncbi:MAG: hypothetical protein ACE5HK_01215 [Candidatus Methylomirabilales bacterium]